MWIATSYSFFVPHPLDAYFSHPPTRPLAFSVGLVANPLPGTSRSRYLRTCEPHARKISVLAILSVSLPNPRRFRTVTRNLGSELFKCEIGGNSRSGRAWPRDHHALLVSRRSDLLDFSDDDSIHDRDDRRRQIRPRPPMASFLHLYEPLEIIGNGSFGIIRKVRRKSDNLVRLFLLFVCYSDQGIPDICAEGT